MTIRGSRVEPSVREVSLCKVTQQRALEVELCQAFDVAGCHQLKPWTICSTLRSSQGRHTKSASQKGQKMQTL